MESLIQAVNVTVAGEAPTGGRVTRPAAILPSETSDTMDGSEDFQLMTTAGQMSDAV